MAERTGWRDESYSAWHRPGSISRYIAMDKARQLCQCDLDATYWMEYWYGKPGKYRRVPLQVAVIETALDTPENRSSKTTTGSTLVQAKYARYACIPFCVTLYSYDLAAMITTDDGRSVRDIEHFLVRAAHDPTHGRSLVRTLRDHRQVGKWAWMTPRQYAQFLVLLRDNAIRLYHGRETSSRLAKRQRTLFAEHAREDQPELALLGEDRSA